MDKIAAYEMLLEDHPLWEKEAGAQAEAYKRLKPYLMRTANSRSPAELAAYKHTLRGMKRKDLQGILPGFTAPLSSFPRGTSELARRAKGIQVNRNFPPDGSM
jgi:hypothetical protein